MTNLLFGFRGRITRAKFWLVALAIFVVELILFAALSYRIGGKALFYPPVVFCGIWAFDLSLLWACGDYFYPLITETLAIFVIGAAMFVLGSYAGESVPADVVAGVRHRGQQPHDRGGGVQPDGVADAGVLGRVGREHDDDAPLVSGDE